MLATAIHGRPRGFIKWNPQAKTGAADFVRRHPGSRGNRTGGTAGAGGVAQRKTRPP